MTAFQKIFVNVVCLVLLSAMVAAAAYLLSPADDRNAYAMVAAAVTLALFPLFNHAVKLAGPSRSTLRGWNKSLLLSGAILGAMLVVDIFLGIVSHPEWPTLRGARSNLGFVVTLFVSPVLLAAIFGLLRAVLIKLLVSRRVVAS